MKRAQHLLARIRWKKIGIIAAVAAPVVMIAVQLAYPWDATRLYQKVGGVSVGGVSREKAADAVQSAFRDAPLELYFANADEAYRTTTLGAVGITVQAEDAVNAAMYPWWLRLVPTSLWWAHRLSGDVPVATNLGDDNVRQYVVGELGEDCHVQPKDATLTLKDDALQVVPSEDGGRCQLAEVVDAVKGAAPTVAATTTVRLPMEIIAPNIDNAEAEALKRAIDARIGQGVTLQFGDQTNTIDATTVRQWLVFSADGDNLRATVSAEKSQEVLTQQWQEKVAIAAGVVTITTRDFVEVGRTGGGEGRALNITDTAANLTAYLMGEHEAAEVATTVVPPQPRYVRSYSASDTGLSALMQHFANDNPGTYGVSLIELSGQRRRAGANEAQTFTTASTYKAYVAYSVLRRIESGAMNWDQPVVGGRTVAKCFDDMIVLSDNPCAEEFVRRIGYTPLHRDVQALGLSNTSFIDRESFKTTAGDLSTFMASLEAGQLPINAGNRTKLLDALKRNVHRRGIPAGATGQVADKVGFLDGLLHDTAIVYAPGGTYVLTIMTDGSSWGKIAELTREIEKLRG